MKRCEAICMMQIFVCVCFITVVCFPVICSAGNDNPRSRGQTVYVPVYSNVLIGDRPHAFELASTICIRNTDMEHSLKIIVADYYDNDGNLIRKFIAKPLILKPLATTAFFIEEKDTRGGLGANFIVTWKADEAIDTPIIECVMIGTKMGLGMSLVSPGKIIRDITK